MTLDQILERRYPRPQIYTFDGREPVRALERFRALPEEKRAGFRLIRGHLAFGIHTVLPNPSTYITFLRNPVERVISQYYYARSSPDHYLYERLKKEGTSLYEYVAQQMTPEISNQQTGTLAGIETQTWKTETTRASLEAAKQHLQTHFRVVGLTEHFDTGLLLIQRAFGWSLPLYLRENVTAGKPAAQEVDSRARGLIAELNALDIELYAFARELFQAECQAYGSALKSDLARFSQWNARYQQFVGPVRRWRLKFARSGII